MKFLRRKQTETPETQLAAALDGHSPPALPQGVMKLMQLMRDPDSEITDVTEALSWQPGLVVKVLQTVNSAAYGMARKVDSVSHAVAILGRSKLEQLVLGVAVKENLPTRPARGYDAQRFWEAAFFRAALARGIAGRLHPADEAQSFTAGLLQDMAVPLLAHAQPKVYGEVLETWHGTPTAHLHDLEQEALGWSHDVVGGQLARSWELPESLVELIGAHHGSETNVALPPALRLVSLHRETACEHGLEAITEVAQSEFEVDPDWMRGLVEESERQATELSQLL